MYGGIPGSHDCSSKAFSSDGDGPLEAFSLSWLCAFRVAFGPKFSTELLAIRPSLYIAESAGGNPE